MTCKEILKGKAEKVGFPFTVTRIRKAGYKNAITFFDQLIRELKKADDWEFAQKEFKPLLKVYRELKKALP